MPCVLVMHSGASQARKTSHAVKGWGSGDAPSARLWGTGGWHLHLTMWTAVQLISYEASIKTLDTEAWAWHQA